MSLWGKFAVDSCWGLPLDEYLKPIKYFSLRKYPLDRVLSAIEAITTNDPPQTISDATLEAVLSVSYYPEYLVLLDIDFCLPLYHILNAYLAHYTLLERAFGVLLMQVHGIFSMVEFLELHGRLATFVESLAISPTRGVNVFHLLSREVVQITGLDQNPSMDTVAQCLSSILPSLGDPQLRSLPYSNALLYCTLDARAEFAKAYRRVPGFGWPLALMKMLPELQSELKDSKTEEDRYKATKDLGRLWDIASRYLLVAPLYERCMVATLASGINCTGGDESLEDPFVEPRNSWDLEGVVSALFCQLSTRPPENTVAGLRHLDAMAEYTFRLLCIKKRYDALPWLLTAAYTRLWAEITCSPSSRYPVKEVASFGLECLRYTAYIGEGWSRAEVKAYPGDTPALNVAMALSRVDFFNLVGRLFLSCGVSSIGFDFECTISSDTFISEAQYQLRNLSLPISGYAMLLASTFQPYYFNWLKVLGYMSQLLSMSLPSSQVLLPHLKHVISAWVDLGEAVGYLECYEAPPCSYIRCPGFTIIDYQSLACGGCLHTAYCTTRCQQADWTCRDTPHNERCGERAVNTGLTGDALWIF